MNITGNLLLGEGIGEGDVQLTNVSVGGSTAIHGGGANSIHFTDAALGPVVIDKKNGSVRLVAEGSTIIKDIQVQTAAKVESLTGSSIHSLTLSPKLPADAQIRLAGSFKTVTILASSLNIDISGGTLDAVSVDKTAGKNKLSNSGSIKSLILNSGIEISGKGSIEEAVINATGIIMESSPVKLTKGSDVPADVKVNIGGLDKPVSSAAPAAVGGFGGGGSAGGGGGGDAVSVTPTAVPTAVPTAKPTAVPTAAPTAKPTAVPTAAPTAVPTAKPTAVPTVAPTAVPTVAPTAVPTAAVTPSPYPLPIETPYPTPVATPGNPATSQPPINPGVIKGVIERADGKASDTGTIYMYRDYSGGRALYDTSVTAGKFSINLPDGIYQIYLLNSVSAGETVSLYYKFNVINGKATEDIRLVIPVQQTGSVSYSDGTAVKNGEIIVKGRDSFNPVIFYSSSVQNGSIRFNLPDGEYTADVLLLHDTKEKIYINYPFEVIGGLTNINIVLAPKVEGSIRYMDDSPVFDGWLELIRTDDLSNTPVTFDVRDGKFNLFLPDGSYKVNLLRDFQGRRIMINKEITIVNGKSANGPIAFRVPLEIAGMIYNKDGTPLKDGFLLIENADTSDTYAADIVNGQFYYYLPDGSYQVFGIINLQHGPVFPYLTFTVQNGRSTPAELIIQLPSSNVTGTLKYADGTAVPDGAVYLEAVGGPGIARGVEIKSGSFVVGLPDGEYVLKTYYNYSIEQSIKVNHTFHVKDGQLVLPLDITLDKE
ncbi:putative hemoglobin and hemoglobin-haptoglobin-binding protein 3 precursor [compost metagenome]